MPFIPRGIKNIWFTERKEQIIMLTFCTRQMCVVIKGTLGKKCEIVSVLFSNIRYMAIQKHNDMHKEE